MECGRQQSNVKTLLLQGCALRKFHVTDDQNTRDYDQFTSDRKARDQSAFCTFHTFLVEVQTNAGYKHATHT